MSVPLLFKLVSGVGSEVKVAESEGPALRRCREGAVAGRAGLGGCLVAAGGCKGVSVVDRTDRLRGGGRTLSGIGGGIRGIRAGGRRGGMATSEVSRKGAVA